MSEKIERTSVSLPVSEMIAFRDLGASAWLRKQVRAAMFGTAIDADVSAGIQAAQAVEVLTQFQERLTAASAKLQELEQQSDANGLWRLESELNESNKFAAFLDVERLRLFALVDAQQKVIDSHHRRIESLERPNEI